MLNKFRSKHPFLFHILFCIVAVTIVITGIFLPMILVLSTHSAWFLLLYIPVIGIGLGIITYDDC